MGRDRTVCYITDEKYAMPTCVSLTSLKMAINSGYSVDVYIICDNVSRASKQFFLELSDDLFRIVILDVDATEYEEIAEELRVETDNY